MNGPDWRDDSKVQAFGQMMQGALVLGRVMLGADKSLSVALAAVVEEMEQHLGRNVAAQVLGTFAEGMRATIKD